MKTFKPFLFIKTAVAWGTDATEAYERLYNDPASELIQESEDWVCDEIQSEDPEWIEANGGEIEEYDDEDILEEAD